jgi:hypothetical protein
MVPCANDKLCYMIGIGGLARADKRSRREKQLGPGTARALLVTHSLHHWLPRPSEDYTYSNLASSGKVMHIRDEQGIMVADLVEG